MATTCKQLIASMQGKLQRIAFCAPLVTLGICYVFGDVLMQISINGKVILKWMNVSTATMNDTVNTPIVYWPSLAADAGERIESMILPDAKWNV
jgi:hypothetical protein